MIRVPALALAVLCATSIAVAEGPGGGDPLGRRRPPAFLAELFRPEVVIRNQGEIALSAEQRKAITSAIRETQDRVLPLQWELEAKSEEVAKAFATPRIDPERGMALAAPVIALEERIKTEHLRLLIRIKNELTPEQQEKLRALQPEGWRPGRR
jgi:Spy/CpxP family protein refolding chaperone